VGTQLTNYEKGRKLEKQVLDYFRYHGFVGLRAAQSKGPYDVMVSPPLAAKNQSTLHIQCGPKSKTYLEELFDVAQKHHGLKAHLYREAKCEPKISFLMLSNYVSLQEFLAYCYGIPMPHPWKQALDGQANIDRESRKIKNE